MLSCDRPKHESIDRRMREITCGINDGLVLSIIKKVALPVYWYHNYLLCPIVEFEQGGQARAEYGEALLQRIAQDLGAQLGRGSTCRPCCSWI
jgi:hypothetical protein